MVAGLRDHRWKNHPELCLAAVLDAEATGELRNPDYYAHRDMDWITDCNIVRHWLNAHDAQYEGKDDD